MPVLVKLFFMHLCVKIMAVLISLLGVIMPVSVIIMVLMKLKRFLQHSPLRRLGLHPYSLNTASIAVPVGIWLHQKLVHMIANSMLSCPEQRLGTCYKKSSFHLQNIVEKKL